VNEILPPITKGPNQVLNGVAASYFDDAKKLGVVHAEKGISLFLNHRVMKVETEGQEIRSLVIQSTLTSQQNGFMGACLPTAQEMPISDLRQVRTMNIRWKI